MIRDDLTPEQLAVVAIEGQRLTDAAAAGKPAEQPAQQPNVVVNVQREVHERVKARNITLIAIHHFEIDGRAFTHGAEIPPGLIDDKKLDRLLDQGRVRECPERRSLFRLFHVFNDCKETEQLDADELAAYSLPR